jgi:hypothetical protein
VLTPIAISPTIILLIVIASPSPPPRSPRTAQPRHSSATPKRKLSQSFPERISPILEPFQTINTSFQTHQIVSFSLCRYYYARSSSRLILCKASGGTKKLFVHVEGDLLITGSLHPFHPHPGLSGLHTRQVLQKSRELLIRLDLYDHNLRNHV